MLKSYVEHWQQYFSAEMLLQYIQTAKISCPTFHHASFVYGCGNHGCRSQRADRPRGVQGVVRRLEPAAAPPHLLQP